MVLKSFISPNLRHKNGKIYYLNNKELYVSDWNYVEENYYIHFNDLEMNNSKMECKEFFWSIVKKPTL